MRFQERDAQILKAIQDNDGVLAKRHIKSMFWPDTTDRAMEQRLAKLKAANYITWPDLKQRNTRPIPEPICWLDWRGALYLTSLLEANVEPPTHINERQLRLLQIRMKKAGFSWFREPRWNSLAHDLAVADFRLSVHASADRRDNLNISQWISESSFRKHPDEVDFSFKGNNGKKFKRSRRICPDGFFLLEDERRKATGQPHKVRFLLEVDMASHDNTSFGIEKAAAGAAYIGSQAYKERFQTDSGRWLVVTTGERRLKNLIRQTELRAGDRADLFYFTTFDHLAQEPDVFTDPIWKQTNTEGWLALPLT